MEIKDILIKAASLHKISNIGFEVCVGIVFWRLEAVTADQQQTQAVYVGLCDLGFTPLESEKNRGTFCRVCESKLMVRGVCTIYCPECRT